MKRSVPALIVGEGATALGALRCLRMAGIPTYVACPRRSHATWSRWYRPAPGAGDWNGSIGTQTPAALRGVQLDRAVLIPAMDDAAIWVSDFPNEELKQRFLASTSSRRTLETLQDKARFAEFLEDTDIPHPRTFPLRSRDDIAALPFDELDRIFLKPVNSQKFSKATGHKALWASNRKELTRLWDELQSRGLDVVAQEYVPGPSHQHYFLDGFRDRHGVVTGLFARRRLRIYPSYFGNSSYCESIPLSDVGPAEKHLRELLAKLDYRGIFSAEFKRDSRDGLYRILEVNIRAWLYVEFAARCGVNVCEMAYDDALGEPVKAVSRQYDTGSGCLYFPGDLKAVFKSNRRERGPLRKIASQWLHAHFVTLLATDPLPGVYASVISIRQASKKLLQH